MHCKRLFNESYSYSVEGIIDSQGRGRPRGRIQPQNIQQYFTYRGLGNLSIFEKGFKTGQFQAEKKYLSNQNIYLRG